MKYNLLLIGMLTLSGCAVPVSSVKAICDIPTPTLTERELSLLSDRTVEELATYFTKLDRGCNG